MEMIRLFQLQLEHYEKVEVVHIYALGSYTHKIRLNSGAVLRAPRGLVPRVAIIIDDLGPRRELADAFIRLDVPLSISVLPLMPSSRLIAKAAAKRGCELLLHLPMEPKDYPEVDPGPGALYTAMGRDEVRKTLRKDLQSVPGVRGVNNHMGSRFTADEEKMTVLLGDLKRRNLFYVDSRTTKETVAFDLAKEVGVPTVRRGVFLDNDLSVRAMTFQMARLLGMGRHSGSAVGIGHPHEETLLLLKKFIPELKREVKVVPVSKMVN